MKKLVLSLLLFVGFYSMSAQNSLNDEENTGVIVMVSEDRASGLLADVNGELKQFINPAGVVVGRGDAVAYRKIPLAGGVSGTTSYIGIPIGAGPSGTTSSIIGLPIAAGSSGTTASINLPIGAGPSGTTSSIGLPIGAGSSGTTSEVIVIIKKM